MNNLKDHFTKKEICHFVMIDKYFKKCSQEMIIKMINIIEGTDKISLRILDWFVTRYAKRGIDFTKDGEVFDIHINYKAQLKTYKKRYFDPFRRKNKFNYTFDINGEKKILTTTIGQLNFFSWAISNNIIQYVALNFSNIVSIMNVSNKEEKKKKLLVKQQQDKSKDKINIVENDNSDAEVEEDSESEHNDDSDNSNTDDELTLSFD